MGFRTGQISYRRYQTVGQAPEEVSGDVVEALRKEIHTPGPVPKLLGMQYGWCGGRDQLDGEIDLGEHVFDNSVLFGLLEELNEPPGKLVKALYRKALVEAGKTRQLSKSDRKEAKANAKAEADDEARKGRHCKVSVTPVLWDLDARAIYTPAGGKRADRLMELFERSFNLKLWCMTAGVIAEREGVALNVPPEQFVNNPGGLFMGYGFLVRGGPHNHALDFLGCEFLLWLMWMQASASSSTRGVHGLWVDPTAAMTLDDPYQVLGRTTLGTAEDLRPGEPASALAAGKMPVSVTVSVPELRLKGPMTLHAKDLAVSGLDIEVPDVLHDPRQIIEYRLETQRNVDHVILNAFSRFLLDRKREERWRKVAVAMRQFISGGLLESVEEDEVPEKAEKQAKSSGEGKKAAGKPGKAKLAKAGR
jgi:hypothetical protein